MDFLYPFKAVYYYSYFLYIKYYGSYEQKVRLEQLYNKIDYEWEFETEI